MDFRAVPLAFGLWLGTMAILGGAPAGAQTESQGESSVYFEPTPQQKGVDELKDLVNQGLSSEPKGVPYLNIKDRLDNRRTNPSRTPEEVDKNTHVDKVVNHSIRTPLPIDTGTLGQAKVLGSGGSAINQKNVAAGSNFLTIKEKLDPQLVRNIIAAPQDATTLDLTGVAVTTLLDGDPKTSSLLASELLRRDPSSIDGLKLRAASRLKTGDFKAASVDAARAAALAPEDRFARGLLAQAQSRASLAGAKGRPLGKEAAARMRAEIEAMLAGVGGLSEGRTGAGAGSGYKTAGAGPWSAAGGGAAGSAMSQAVSANGRALAQRAQEKLAQGDARGAVADANRALALNPRHCDALNQRAVAFNLLGSYPQAVSDATASLEACPRGNSPALLARSSALSRLGRPREAKRDADEAVALDRRDATAYRVRADADEGLGDLAAMALDYQAAAFLDPLFRAVYEEAMRRRGLPIEPLSLETNPALAAMLGATAAPRGAVEAAPAKRSGGNSRLVRYAVAILAGGFLIALGILHAARKGATTGRQLNPSPVVAARAASGPDRIGGVFELGPSVGQGGMGVVYSAVDRSLDRKVAVKRLRDELKGDARERERFLKEAKTVAALRHPSIVEIYSIVEEAGDLFIVFEFVEGRTLDDVLESSGALSLGRAKTLLKPVCEALEYAHGRGVVHRDLKPSNLMVGEGALVKVMDFGIARQAKDSLAKFSMTNTVMGTPLYMAPEAEQGIVRKESDVYALGAMLYEMTTGRRPFPAPATTPQKLARGYPRPSQARAGLPPALDALVDESLEPDPERRLPSAGEFWRRLETLS